MHCPDCRQENPRDARFCNSCGTRLESACGACGHANPTGSRFCNGCGQRLAAGASPSPARFAAPTDYTPKHLAEKILTSKAALEGERKVITVLFADVKGSMELLADRDPEEARKILDPVLELMMEAVHRYEGTVNQVMGDGIMALFGAPVAHEDHAVRACYAALSMQKSLGDYGAGLQRTHGLVETRVGLHSGEVVIRTIASDLRMDYSAVGQTTHLAARMEQIARAGTIRLTADTLRLAEGFVQVQALGPVPIKGLPAPVEAFELLGAMAVPGRFHAAAGRGLTRFIGRAAELESLHGAGGRAAQGHGQVVALVGEPGVGKSRLVWEFTRSQRARESLLLECGAASYGQATPYRPLVELLKAYFQIEERDDPRKVREKVTGTLLGRDLPDETTRAVVLSLLDVATDDPRWDALDPAQRRQRTREALRRLVLHESAVQPVVLVVEDLQWIDGETQAVLDALVESLPAARLLLLVTYRPEFRHGWAGKTYYLQLPVDALPAEGTEELVDTLLGPDPALGPLKRLFIERTEGNPLFLEESVRTLVETRALEATRGAYRLATELRNIEVPPTVQAILAARIDRLAAEDKRLLQTAAVIGKDVPLALLEASADLASGDVQAGLTRLRQAEFLYEARLYPDLVYTFKHALTHQVTYASLPQERRRALHAQVVTAIERDWPARLTEHAEALGHHAFQGAVWDKAVSYLRGAGAKALGRMASREAAAHFRQALAALAHLPERRESIELAIDLRFDLRHCLIVVGEFEELGDRLREAEILAASIGDQRRLGWAYAYIAWLLTFPSLQPADLAAAIETGQRAVAIGIASGDVELEAGANYYLGLACYLRGDYRRAIDLTRRNVERFSGERLRHRGNVAGHLPGLLTRHLLALAGAEVGELAEGLGRTAEALANAEPDDHFNLSLLYFAAGVVHLRRGNAEEAIAMLERALALCETAGIAHMRAITTSRLGSACLLAGRTQEALALLEEALAMKAALSFRATMLTALAEGHLAAGRVDSAYARGREALDLGRAIGVRGWEAWTIWLLGEIASHPDALAPETAAERYREAMALAEELGMRPLVAHCHLGLGRLCAKTGRRDVAGDDQMAAATIYRELGMPLWLARAEALALR